MIQRRFMILKMLCWRIVYAVKLMLNEKFWNLSQSICHNTLGSYHCECEKGYEGNGLLDCYLVDACQSITCGPYAHCVEEIASAEKATAATAGSLGGAHNDAKCICDPDFIPDPDPKTRCKRFCEDGYQAVGPRCLGSSWVIIYRDWNLKSIF